MTAPSFLVLRRTGRGAGGDDQHSPGDRGNCSHDRGDSHCGDDCEYGPPTWLKRIGTTDWAAAAYK